jgi:hypothetical protein
MPKHLGFTPKTSFLDQEFTMGSVASERKYLHRGLFERGGTSDTCDDDDAFSCRTDLTTVKVSNVRRVTVRSAKNEVYVFFGAQRRKKQAIVSAYLVPVHLLLHLLERKHAHPFVALSVSLSISYHPTWPRIHT